MCIFESKKKTLMKFIISFLLLLGLVPVQTDIPVEGIQVLYHYMYGNGEDLVLESDYLPHSPVIKRELGKMKVGQTKRITFHQKEDWRLSYALNPFHLKKTKNGFEI